MHRLAGLLFFLAAVFLLWGCAQSVQQTEPITMKAQAQTTENTEVQSFVQRQPLSAQEVQSIVQVRLEQARDLQVQLLSPGLATEQRAEDHLSIQSISGASKSISSTSSPAAELQGAVPVPPGDFDSVQKIRQQAEQIYTPQAAEKLCEKLFDGTAPFLKEADGTLYYLPQQEATFPTGLEYLVDTAVVMRQTVDEITVELTLQAKGSTPIKKSLHLKKEGEEWRLDCVAFPQQVQESGK